MEYEYIKKNFDKYVATFDTTDENIMLKYKHSYKVSEIMEELAIRLDLSEKETLVSKVIGLVHDIGRFIQLDKYNSYSDKNIDHGDIGSEFLDSTKIREFLPYEEYDACVRLSVRYHNKFDYPKLSEKENKFVNMIRDSDKVDIYRVLNESPKKIIFKREELSKDVLNDFMNKEQIKIAKTNTSTDRLLLRMAFLFDMKYREAFDILKEKEYFTKFISKIEVSEEDSLFWEKIVKVSLDYLNKGGI